MYAMCICSFRNVKCSRISSLAEITESSLYYLEITGMGASRKSFGKKETGELSKFFLISQQQLWFLARTRRLLAPTLDGLLSKRLVGIRFASTKSAEDL